MHAQAPGPLEKDTCRDYVPRHCLYAEHGISQIDDLASLEVPPLSDVGTPMEIARLFGGSDAFHEAVRQLGDFLYAA